MNLFICGSRTITDKEWIYSKIENCITHLLCTDYSNITILEGGAKGVDSIAKQWATEHNIPVIEYPPDYEKYHNEACHKRNEAMAADCDFMLDLWTGESTGSLHDIMMAEKYHKDYKVWIYNEDFVYEKSAERLLLYMNQIKIKDGLTLREIFQKVDLSLNEVFKLFKIAVYEETMRKSFMDADWEEGHNSGSSFWIMPVRQGKDSSEGSWGCFCCYDDEISIDEDVVFGYLYLPFLRPYFDKSIKYTCRYADPVEFDWHGYNLYTYETVRKMCKEMKLVAKENSFGDSDFYDSLADRLLLMMERNPDWDYITFEGP